MNNLEKMKIYFIVLLLGTAFVANAQDANLQQWSKEVDPRNVGLLVTEHFIASPHNTYRPNQPITTITYSEICLWYGALRFANVTRSNRLLQQLKDRFMPLYGEEEHLLPALGHVDRNVTGAIPFELYRQTGEEKFLELGFRYADDQWKMPLNAAADKKKEYQRLLDQGLSWQTRFWIDDMYMMTLVQTQAYKVTHDRKYIDRTAHEMSVYLDSLQQTNGLFYHAPDVPFYWGRGNGWMAAGMSELLSSLPEDNEDRPHIMKGYLSMMESLLECQQPNGLWGQLLDDPTSWTETSGSGMFTYAFIMGVKNGWLDNAKYAPAAKKAWIALVGYINSDGLISDVCEGTNKKNDRQYYLDREKRVGDFHGQAPILWCAAALLDNY